MSNIRALLALVKLAAKKRSAARALACLRSFSPDFAPYRRPADLVELPWQETRLLAHEVSRLLWWRPSKGLWWILILLCRVPLICAAQRYKNVSAEELLALYGEGIALLVAPWGHVKRAHQTQSGAPKAKGFEVLEGFEGLEGNEPTIEYDPAERMLYLEAFHQLSKEDQTILLEAMQHHTSQLAEKWRVSHDTAKTRLYRARFHFRKILREPS